MTNTANELTTFVKGNVLLNVDNIVRFVLENDEEALEDMTDANTYDEDGEGTEVLQYLVVTDWLATKLEEKGEVVVSGFRGLTVWGRSTFGQSISMDTVIEDIYNELTA